MRLDTNILSSIRRAKGFSRGVTILIVLALFALVAERSIYYLLLEGEVIQAENPLERLQQRAPHLARQIGLPAQPTAASLALPASINSNNSSVDFATTVHGVQTVLNTLQDRLDQRQSTQKIEIQLRQLQQQLLALDEQAMAEFDAIAQHIEDERLADVIQQRQQVAVATYQAAFNDLIAQLDSIAQASDLASKRQGVEVLQETLASYQFKRSQQPFDPNNLPTKSLQADPTNKPKLKPEEFTVAGLHNTPYIQLAVLGDFTFDKLADASNPAYLAQTIEITLSQTIKDKAAELNHDPVTIYHWVRNNIEWQPTWGAIQNADMTLDVKRGNAMDITSLTIALLRASQIPARYVHGTIDVPSETYKNWAGGFTNIRAAGEYASAGGIPTGVNVSGGEIISIRMEHIWAEAAIDYHPSRGTKNRDADSWLSMDPSFKQYDYLTGLDAVQISGIDPEQVVQDFIDSGQVNEQESWMTGLNPDILLNAQTQGQAALDNYVTTNLPNATVGDVIGGRKTIIQEYPVLPSSLPNRIIVNGARYDKLPGSLQQKISYSFGRDIFGDPLNATTFPWAQLNNERITLSFKPATAADEQVLQSLLPENVTDISQLPSSIPSYLVSVVPELKLNGEVVKTGSVMRLGEELDFTTQVKFAYQSLPPRVYKVAAGSYLNVNIIAGNVSPKKLQTLQDRLEQTNAILETNDPTQIAVLTDENLLGDMFYSGSLGYYAQLLSLSNILGLQQSAHYQLAAGNGTIGYEPKVNYFFGFPRAIETGVVVFDIPIVTIQGMNDGVKEKQKEFIIQTGVLASTLEYTTPEQMFADTNNLSGAISAVKALSKASAAGQRIYQVTQANQTTVLPNIHHDYATMAEIRAALDAGKEVITHTDAVSVPGWSGAGYIILDPNIGDGAYKISGGANGGVEQADPIISVETIQGMIGKSASTIIKDFAVGKLKKFVKNIVTELIKSVKTTAATGITNAQNCLTGEQGSNMLFAMEGLDEVGNISKAGRVAEIGSMLGYIFLLSFATHLARINRVSGDCG